MMASILLAFLIISYACHAEDVGGTLVEKTKLPEVKERALVTPDSATTTKPFEQGNQLKGIGKRSENPRQLEETRLSVNTKQQINTKQQENKKRSEDAKEVKLSEILHQSTQPERSLLLKKRDYSMKEYRDLARAYAAGYEAAMKNIKTRGNVARQQLQTGSFGQKYKPIVMNPTSAAPRPGMIVGKSGIAVNNYIRNLLGNSLYNPRVSKSAIPHRLPTLIGMQQDPGNSGVLLIPDANRIRNRNDDDAVATRRSDIPRPPFSFPPIPPQVAVNAMEKYWVPHTPSSANQYLYESDSSPLEKYRQRKDMFDKIAFPNTPVKFRTEEQRDNIAKLNSRARHRNIYFDTAGGDSYGGNGMLSMQNLITRNRHRRKRYAEDDIQYDYRQRRSHMPYLGQNLDSLGVIRAVPRSWFPPGKAAHGRRNQILADSMKYTYPSPQIAGTVSQPSQLYFGGFVPQSVGVVTPPAATNYYANMFPNMQQQQPLLPQQQLQQQQQQQQQITARRNIIPYFPGFYNQLASSTLGYSYPASYQHVYQQGG